jgi:AbiU2
VEEMTEIDEALLAAPDDLEAELETFRIDEETAQQFFFAYLGVRDLTAKRPDVLAAVNRNPMFWKTTHYSMFVSTFIWLGRMFDQQSAHNVNLLLRMVERNLPTLNREALRDRKAKVITPDQAAECVASKHEMTIDDVRVLRKGVANWRRIYEPVYRHIRDHLAHNRKDVSDLDALLAMTDIEEMKRMFGFFHALHEGLVELYLNGRNPLPLPDVTFVLPPEPKPQRQYHPGEKAFREAQDALLSMLPQAG